MRSARVVTIKGGIEIEYVLASDDHFGSFTLLDKVLMQYNHRSHAFSIVGHSKKIPGGIMKFYYQ